MDYVKVLDKTDAYIKSIVNSPDFCELLMIKTRIEEELKQQIDAFKKAEQDYNDAKKYGSYHPDLKKFQQVFSVKKTCLYSHELVKKYFELQNKIQSMIDEFIVDLTSSISNKFKNIHSLGI